MEQKTRLSATIGAEAYDYLKVISAVQAKSMSEFLTELLMESKARNKALYDQALQFTKKIKCGTTKKMQIEVKARGEDGQLYQDTLESDIKHDGGDHSWFDGWCEDIVDDDCTGNNIDQQEALNAIESGKGGDDEYILSEYEVDADGDYVLDSCQQVRIIRTSEALKGLLGRYI